MRKHTKRRVYGLIYDPMAYVKAGVSPMPEPVLDTLRIRVLGSIENFAYGEAGLPDYREIVDILNMTETMARQGVRPEALHVCRLVEAELLAAADRFEQTHCMTVSTEGLTAIKELHDHHDAQRCDVSQGNYEQALQATTHRIRTHNGSVVDLMGKTAAHELCDVTI